MSETPKLVGGTKREQHMRYISGLRSGTGHFIGTTTEWKQCEPWNPLAMTPMRDLFSPLERDMPTNQKTNHSMSTLGSDQVLQLPQLLADHPKKNPTSKSQCASLTVTLAQRQASSMTPAGFLRMYIYMYSCPHMILTTE